MFTKIRDEQQASPRRATHIAPPRTVVTSRRPSAVSVLPDLVQRAALAVPSEERHVPAARHFVSNLLIRWGVADDDRDSAALVVSELVANAAQHGRPSTTVLVVLARSVLHIEVADHGKGRHTPPQREETDGDEHGRGLYIVEALAERVEIIEEVEHRRTCVDLSVRRRSVQQCIPDAA